MLREIDGTTIRSNGAAQIVFTRGALFYTNRFNDAGKTTVPMVCITVFFFWNVCGRCSIGQHETKESIWTLCYFFCFCWHTHTQFNTIHFVLRIVLCTHCPPQHWTFRVSVILVPVLSIVFIVFPLLSPYLKLIETDWTNICKAWIPWPTKHVEKHAWTSNR